MEPHELLLCVIKAAETEIGGRTTIQKLMYFVSENLGVDIGYSSHFYGPYSSLLSDLLESLVSADFVREERKTTLRYRVMYTYGLTEDGEILIRKLAGEYPLVFKKVKSIIQKCKRITGFNPDVLAWAAKVHLILKEKAKPMTVEEIIDTGKSLGWKLSERDIETATKLLKGLGYVKQV